MRQSVFLRSMYLLLVCFLPLLSSFAQEEEPPPPPIEWGNIPNDQLAMTKFPADTNATAVVLCDYGDATIDDAMNVKYVRHRRIKILTEAGYAWGTHAVLIQTEDGLQEVDDIEGATYTLGPDGSAVVHEMEDDAIFEEAVEGTLRRVKFTLPALAPGCVIEYRYTLISQSVFYMPDWKFQGDEPMLWSEYRMSYPRFLSYAALTTGYELLTIKKSWTATRVVSGEVAAFGRGKIASYAYSRYVLENAPAIRREPFITTTNDYETQLDVQFAGYAIPTGGVKRVLHDWPEFVDELADSKNFGGRIEVTSSVKERAAALTAGMTSEQEKIRAIYNWIDTSIVATANNRNPDRPVDDLLEMKRGNSADVVMLFLSMLKSVGIDGVPVLASSRSHGNIQKLYPIVTQFDRVVACVQNGSRKQFFLPTNPDRPMELLPIELLNVDGLVIQKGTLEWVTLASSAGSVKRAKAALVLHEDGSVDGWLEASAHEYGAVSLRDEIRQKGDTAAAQKIFELEETDATLDSIVIEGRNDSSQPLRVRAHVSNCAAIMPAGDRYYIQPAVTNRLKLNPLRLDQRKFPVDFAYPWELATTVTFSFPRGYVVADTLRECRLETQDNGMTYRRAFTVRDTVVTMTTQFASSRARYEAPNYAELKQMYGRVVAMGNEQFVLQKLPPPEQVIVPVKPAAQKKKR